MNLPFDTLQPRGDMAYTSSSGQRSRQRRATPDSFSAAASRLSARFPVWSFHTTPASTISQSLGYAFEVGGLVVVDMWSSPFGHDGRIDSRHAENVGHGHVRGRLGLRAGTAQGAGQQVTGAPSAICG